MNANPVLHWTDHAGERQAVPLEDVKRDFEQFLRWKAQQAQPATRVSQAVMARLSKALGNPTEVEADPGETVEDALIRMAAEKLAQPSASGEPAETDSYGAALLAAWGKHRADKWADQVPHPTFCAGFRAAWDAAQPTPALVPLTDAQIERAVTAGWLAALECHAHKGMAGWSADRALYIARAIEAAHGIGAPAKEAL